MTLHRSPTEFTGATDGATNLATTGDIYLQKSVSASGSFNTALSPDPMPDIPYPPSRTAMQTYKLDRVASSKDLHDPNAPLLFEFIYPGGLNGTAIFARIYFNGPPSTRGNWIGTGQYVLELRGDGSAWCYQYGKFVTSHASHWDIGVGLRWNSSSNPSAGKHSIEIRPYAVKDTDGGFLGGVISFFTGAGHAGGMLAKPLSQPTQKGIFSAQTQTGSDSNIFAVKARVDPSLTLGKSIPVQPGPITLELSRLARILAKIVALSYKPSGSLTDGAFSFEIPPTTDDDIWIYTRATLPAGTSLTVELKDSDGTSATLVESIPGQYHFHPGANGRRAYTVTITLATSDSRVTPILRGYSVRWDGKLTTVSPGAFWGNRSTATTLSMPDRLHSEFSITSGEDPSYETASFSIADLTDSLTRLKVRGDIPVLITTTYDPDHLDRRSVIFTGYVQRAPWTKRGVTSGALYPASNWGEFEVSCVGIWKRIQDTLSAVRWNFAGDGGDFDTDPFVVDVIRTVLQWATGEDLSRLDVPKSSDLPVRLTSPAGGVGSEFLIEPGADLAQFILTLVKDYLAYHICYDGNASPSASPDDYGGMWRVLPPATPPYNYLAQFVPDTIASSGGLVVPIGTGAYPPSTVGGVDGVQTTWYAKDTYRSWPFAPEGNKIVVSATGDVPGSAGDTEGLSFIVSYNQASFNFKNVPSTDPQYPSPDSPDYLTRIKQVYFFDPALASGDGSFMRWVAKRFERQVFHSPKIVTFEAPLILVTDTTDHYQCRPRPLRYYDPVALSIRNSAGVLQTTTALVQSVTPAWEKDWLQMAVYEVMIPPNDFQGQLAA